ncbi:MAG: DUF1688 family protein [Gammaproteobacteria bacterium]
MKQTDVSATLTLLTPEAVRQRCLEVFAAAEANALNFFQLNKENFDAALELVVAEITSNYPNGKVPFHSRWRHFEYGDQDFWFETSSALVNHSKAEVARRQIDLAVISVLLDAGAGPGWSYADSKSGITFDRSEGLAIASLRLFESGLLSLNGSDDPLRVDALPLKNITPEILASLFQVSETNSLVGLEERANLLNRLGQALVKHTHIFESGGALRPGNLYDYLLQRQENGVLAAREILIAILEGMGEIWPDGSWVDGIAIGDAAWHEAIKRSDITDGIVPFHKLSQWMSYSLIEPLQLAGMKIVNLDALTGLAEYRNGGLFIDTGTISLRDKAQMENVHDPKSPLIVEWRALTVTLLDQLAEQIRQHMNTNSESMPLVSILQGGTWSAGRRIAQQLRADATPPLRLKSRGTIF